MTAKRIEGRIANTVLRYASRGNNLSAIRQFGRPEKGGRELVYALFDTTSLDVFQTLYPWAKHHLDTDPTNGHTSEQLLMLAARRGAVPILDYLFRQVYPASVSWSVDSPPDGLPELYLLDIAAESGREEAVVYLLGKGFPVSSSILEEAVQYGNPTIVQLCLDRAPVEPNFALEVAGAPDAPRW
ncbi:hypothetical protein PG988_012331 [Apiospora saccharicola]